MVKVLAAIIGVTDIERYISKHSYVKQVMHDELSAVEEVSREEVFTTTPTDMTREGPQFTCDGALVLKKRHVVKLRKSFDQLAQNR